MRCYLYFVNETFLVPWLAGLIRRNGRWLLIPVRSAVARASGTSKRVIKSIYMQRLAIFSFIGVVLLLFAFTASETKKPAPVCKVAGGMNIVKATGARY